MTKISNPPAPTVLCGAGVPETMITDVMKKTEKLLEKFSYRE